MLYYFVGLYYADKSTSSQGHWWIVLLVIKSQEETSYVLCMQVSPSQFLLLHDVCFEVSIHSSIIENDSLQGFSFLRAFGEFLLLS